MYQQVLRRFAHFNAIQLSEKAPLMDLIMLALKEEDLDPEHSDDSLSKRIAEVSYILFEGVQLIYFYSHFTEKVFYSCSYKL